MSFLMVSCQEKSLLEIFPLKITSNSEGILEVCHRTSDSTAGSVQYICEKTIESEQGIRDCYYHFFYVYSSGLTNNLGVTQRGVDCKFFDHIDKRRK